MAITVVLPRGTYDANEARGTAAIVGGSRFLRFIVQRHDGAQGETWPADGAIVWFDWSRNPNGPWSVLAGTHIGNDVGVENDPRGITQGHAYHSEMLVTCPAAARHVRVRFRANATLRTGVGVEEVA